MSRPVVLSADSTCDIGPELTARYRVQILPFNVILEDTEYLDGVSIDADRVYEIYNEKGVLPHTAAINADTYTRHFKQFTDQGCDVVHLCLGHGLSVSCQNAMMAAGEMEHVYIVDTCNLSTGSGLAVLEAAKRIEAGMEAEQVAKEVQALTSRCHASFTLNTLEFLYKGGRCSALAAFGANLLKLKPCIEVNNQDGTMSVGKKYRGPIEKVREEYVRDKLLGRDDIDYEKIFITHSGTSDERVEAVKKVVQECGDFRNIYVTRAGCTISCHCGAETLGVLFMTKE